MTRIGAFLWLALFALSAAAGAGERSSVYVESGADYHLLFSSTGRYLGGFGTANPPVRGPFGTTGFAIPENAFFFRNDLGIPVRHTDGTWGAVFVVGTAGTASVPAIRAPGAANAGIFFSGTNEPSLTHGGVLSGYGSSGTWITGTGGLNTSSGALITSGATNGFTLNRTMTAAGTVGAQTINRHAGSVNFAAAATSLVVTNSVAIATSGILLTPMSNDATCKSFAVVRGAGSFTAVANAACTAETAVFFLVTN